LVEQPPLVEEPVPEGPLEELAPEELVAQEPLVEGEALEGLGRLDEGAAEEVDEWRAFTEEPEAVDVGPPAVDVEPGPADPFAVEAPPEKPGLFGRRRRRRRIEEVSELAAAEDMRLRAEPRAEVEPAEVPMEAQPPPWEPPEVEPEAAEAPPGEAAGLEGAMVPEGWYAEIDEDALEVPPAVLPEQEEGEPARGAEMPEGAPAAPLAESAPPERAAEPREMAGVHIDEAPELHDDIVSGAATMEHQGLAQEILAAEGTDTELQAIAAPMAGLDSGVVGFGDLGVEEAHVEAVRSDLGLRVITGVVLVGLLLGALWVSGELLAGFIGVLALLGLVEFYGTLRSRGYQPLALFGYVGGIGMLAATWFHGLQAVPAAILSTTVVVFFFYAFAPNRRDALTNGGLTVLGVLWIAGSISFVLPIIRSEDFRVLVLAFAATTVAMDVGAYGFGRAWGSSRLAPVLSPNKTVEGLAGGVILAVVVAVAAGYQFEPLDIRSGAYLGLIVAVVAPLGDLAESMMKRSLGVKDMGSVLPGHGGILDRIDAFLFVLPAAWVLYEALGLLS
jgi:phosphatidate cytidylyltransferase